MNIPDQTTAEAFPRYSKGDVVADSTLLHWPDLYVRRFRFPRVVDRFLVPATAEPLISCVIQGAGEFQEREMDGPWQTRHLQQGDIFITRAAAPYEIRCKSPAGMELDFVVIHLPVEHYLAAVESAYPGRTHQVDVIDFFGRDEVLAHLCLACAEMLAARLPGDSRSVASLAQSLAAWLVEKYMNATVEKPDFRGLPIRQIRQVEDYVREQLAEEISVETLAALVRLSPFHFSRVFKQATGMTPLQFVTRERITRAQQLIRETSFSLIEIGLEVGYTNPSYFAQVFRRVAGVTPSEFRAGLP